MRSFVATLFVSACSFSSVPAAPSATFDHLPAYPQADLWPHYRPAATTFRLWAPTATAVRLRFYRDGQDPAVLAEFPLTAADPGLWAVRVPGDQKGRYYTLQVQTPAGWLAETPGIYATAVGVNGQRAAILDLSTTNPPDWAADRGPTVSTPNEAIIYEVHVRDFTIDPSAGSTFPGKFLGLAETGTTGPDGVTTGLDHLRELGVTHVHLLPAFDHYAIDETDLARPQYNWGYDPQNYNVPEGSFATDPFDAAVRIREFKQLVRTLHTHGLGVILDVVYNHTGRTAESNFNQEVPGYYYRQAADGSWSNASGCGNETASERPMMRKFMIESVCHWAREYHIDGFRFDLMGIHDVETMKELAAAVKAINPSAVLYGEGWLVGDTPLPVAQQVIKANISRVPQVSAFSDDLRDALKGSVFDDHSTGFVSGASGTEEAIKFGVVGAIEFPGIDYAQVPYSGQPWAREPWQAISYVTCHDNHTLFDKLHLSRLDADESTLIAMDQLANAIVLTTQGVPFLHAGVELLRSKQGEHNSYNLPDAINRIDWTAKAAHRAVFDYYRGIIALRRAHPAFNLPTAASVRDHLTFLPTVPGLVGFTLADHANGDPWRDIRVIYNARPEAQDLELAGDWRIAVLGDHIDPAGRAPAPATVHVPGISMAIFFRE